MQPDEIFIRTIELLTNSFQEGWLLQKWLRCSVLKIECTFCRNCYA
ncbi:hypothetical protein VRK_29440 [Vibrio sp. MEBiC08052]|nr:hypothetical protein VRK_29440 [Vibrio sp. MEBiC08052]